MKRSQLFVAVFRIRDILVRIRMRIRMRIRPFDYQIRMQIRMRIRLLLFSSVTFKVPTKNNFCSVSFYAYSVLMVPTFTLSLLLLGVSWTFLTVLRIRDVYPGSEFFPSRIPDPGSKRFPIRIKEFKYFNPKNFF
jgi:hypothetical protein